MLKIIGLAVFILIASFFNGVITNDLIIGILTNVNTPIMEYLNISFKWYYTMTWVIFIPLSLLIWYLPGVVNYWLSITGQTIGLTLHLYYTKDQLHSLENYELWIYPGIGFIVVFIMVLGGLYAYVNLLYRKRNLSGTLPPIEVTGLLSR